MVAKLSKKRRLPKRKVRRHTKLIPNFVEEWRLFRGFESQSELARKAGLPSQTISRLEAHTMAWTFASMEQLAAALECNPADLIGVDPTERSRRARENRLHDMVDKLPKELWPRAEGVIAALLEGYLLGQNTKS